MMHAYKNLVVACVVALSGGCTIAEPEGASGEATSASRAGEPGCTEGYRKTVGNLRMSARAGCKQKVVLALHGGAWVSGAAIDMDLVAAPMNDAGVVYASLEYTNGAPMPKLLGEVAAALANLRDNAEAYGIDADRVGLMGFSAGAHLALEAGLIDGHLRWIGSFSGPPDLADLERFNCGPPAVPFICDAIHHVMDGTLTAVPESYRVHSPTENLTRLVGSGVSAPSFYFGHGADDEIVPVAAVDRMVVKLDAMGVRVAYDRPAGTHVAPLQKLVPSVVANAARELGAVSNPPAYGEGVPDETHFPIHRCYDAKTQNHAYVFSPADCRLSGLAYDNLAFSVVKGGEGTVPIFVWRGPSYDYVLGEEEARAHQLQRIGPLGSLYAKQVTGTVPIYLCERASDSNVVPTKSSTCEDHADFRIAAVLGYGF